MAKRLRLLLIPILLLLLIFFLYRILYPPELLEVHFIDVGQGDAILIQSPRTTVLIDGGDRFHWVKAYLVDYLKQQDVDAIDFIISTHPHADHIGGLSAVIETFPVGAIYDSGRSHTSQTFFHYLHLVEEKGIPYYTPRSGEIIQGEDLEFFVIHPAGDVEEYSLNNSSVVVQLVFGEVIFLFTGDIEREAEEEILLQQEAIQSTILKVAHHGSRTSTTVPFLEAVSPEVAVILCGKDNPFGHPHGEVLSLFHEYGIQVYRTDVQGSILITTDGRGYQVKPQGREAIGGEKINLNTASSSILQSLPGIGPVTARRIIDYREKYGDFQSIQEITSVSGIGEVRFHDMKERITVGDVEKTE